MKAKGTIRYILSELKTHLPYSIFSVTLGIIIVGLLSFIAQGIGLRDISLLSEELFHIFHPIHILFSAVATTAMFWRNEKRLLKAIIVASVGTIGICGISDIFMPYISGVLLGVNMHLHICIIEHKALILPFVITGILVGLIVSDSTEKTTIFSHAAHILISSMASILYLIAFGSKDWIAMLGLIFIYMVLSVVIPCCTSDIIFPLVLAKNHRES